ncbi:MAG TPA: phasin family protein [Steroidobacteraceae bacterium]
MTNPTFDFNSFIDAGKKAFAPVVKFNELSVQSFERIARQQYAFAGEMLEFSLKQLQLTSTVRDINDLTARQIELSTQFAERATQRSQDLIKLSTEHQAQLTKWFDQTVTESAQNVSESAKSAKKAA